MPPEKPRRAAACPQGQPSSQSPPCDCQCHGQAEDLYSSAPSAPARRTSRSGAWLSCRRFEIKELQADELCSFVGNKTNVSWVFSIIEVTSRLWPTSVIGRRQLCPLLSESTPNHPIPCTEALENRGASLSPTPDTHARGAKRSSKCLSVDELTSMSKEENRS